MGNEHASQWLAQRFGMTDDAGNAGKRRCSPPSMPSTRSCAALTDNFGVDAAIEADVFRHRRFHAPEDRAPRRGLPTRRRAPLAPLTDLRDTRRIRRHGRRASRPAAARAPFPTSTSGPSSGEFPSSASLRFRAQPRATAHHQPRGSAETDNRSVSSAQRCGERAAGFYRWRSASHARAPFHC